MKIAKVEMIGGAAGDMLLGAWIDAGLDVNALERALRTIVADGWELVVERVIRQGIAAAHVDLVIPGEDERAHDAHGHHVHDHHKGPYHTLGDIIAIVERSGLAPRQIERASRVYRRLAEAESQVHGSAVDAVHFHEVGQIDAILDVAGTCIALDLLEIDALHVSAFPVGKGSVQMHHGSYPNPGPATLELMRGWPLRTVDLDAELVTTTGAAILTTLGSPAPAPDMTLERIGYGAGRSDFPIPNVVRVTIGTPVGADARPTTDDVVVLEANIDDMSPQHYELVLERLFAAGALDAWLIPIVMKKGRPAVTIAALAPPFAEPAVAAALLRETTTLGVRIRSERRRILVRESATIETPFGAVRVKRAEVDGAQRSSAEYDDLVRIARERELPLWQVVRVVQAVIDEGALR